jgi:PAS domain S-box-containing protein
LLLIENTTLSRITKLGSEVSGVAVANDFSMRVTYSGDDEIGHLAKSINWMLQQLEGTYAQIKNCLIQSEDRYQILFSRSGDLICLFSLSDWDNHESIIDVNDAACKRLGYTREEVLTRPLRSLFAQDVEKIVPPMKQQCEQKGDYSGEAVFITRSQEKIPVTIYAHIIHEPEQPAVLMICHEVARH